MGRPLEIDIKSLDFNQGGPIDDFPLVDFKSPLFDIKSNFFTSKVIFFT